jgi:hypothetical protein
MALPIINIIVSIALLMFYVHARCQRILRRQFGDEFFHSVLNANCLEFRPLTLSGRRFVRHSQGRAVTDAVLPRGFLDARHRAYTGPKRPPFEMMGAREGCETSD